MTASSTPTPLETPPMETKEASTETPKMASLRQNLAPPPMESTSGPFAKAAITPMTTETPPVDPPTTLNNKEQDSTTVEEQEKKKESILYLLPKEMTMVEMTMETAKEETSKPPPETVPPIPKTAEKVEKKKGEKQDETTSPTEMSSGPTETPKVKETPKKETSIPTTAEKVEEKKEETTLLVSSLAEIPIAKEMMELSTLPKSPPAAVSPSAEKAKNQGREKQEEATLKPPPKTKMEMEMEMKTSPATTPNETENKKDVKSQSPSSSLSNTPTPPPTTPTPTPTPPAVTVVSTPRPRTIPPPPPPPPISGPIDCPSTITSFFVRNNNLSRNSTDGPFHLFLEIRWFDLPPPDTPPAEPFSAYVCWRNTSGWVWVAFYVSLIAGYIFLVFVPDLDASLIPHTEWVVTYITTTWLWFMIMIFWTCMVYYFPVRLERVCCCLRLLFGDVVTVAAKTQIIAQRETITITSRHAPWRRLLLLQQGITATTIPLIPFKEKEEEENQGDDDEEEGRRNRTSMNHRRAKITMVVEDYKKRTVFEPFGVMRFRVKFIWDGKFEKENNPNASNNDDDEDEEDREVILLEGLRTEQEAMYIKQELRRYYILAYPATRSYNINP